MITILSRIFIKNRDDVSSPEVRAAYGTLCSIVGIFLNVVLFIIKLTAGTLSGSVAIVADAVNNLSDAGSSLISLLGFRMSEKAADEDHPFGHGRMEYISGVIVSVIIIFMGIELLKSSAEKIFSPVPVEGGTLTAVILVISIAVKLYMAFYNNKIGAKINSSSMRAVKYDSLSDSIATTFVLISYFVGVYAKINIDGYAGAVVSLFVLWAGIKSLRETVAPLLGQPADRELVAEVERIVMSHETSKGIHDLIVHDYGMGRVMISLHVEVDGSGDIYELHDEIDRIENELAHKLSCDAVIHMDPILIGDEKTERLKNAVREIVKDLNDRMTIHDFRMVPGPSHTNLIFDVVVPFDANIGENEIKKQIREELAKLDGGVYNAVIKIDKSYV